MIKYQIRPAVGFIAETSTRAYGARYDGRALSRLPKGETSDPLGVVREIEMIGDDLRCDESYTISITPVAFADLRAAVESEIYGGRRCVALAS
jgi:hypothetical protein